MKTLEPVTKQKQVRSKIVIKSFLSRQKINSKGSVNEKSIRRDQQLLTITDTHEAMNSSKAEIILATINLSDTRVT